MSIQRSAAVIIIGNEILSGQTQDANVSFLARKLNTLGIRVQEVRIIPDDQQRIVDSVTQYRRQYDFVFTTGGIGPTHDDITAESIAIAFGKPFIPHPEATTMIKNAYAPDQLNTSRLKMGMMPAGASLILNPIGTAPTFKIENVFILPGIPKMVEAIFEVLGPLLGKGPEMLSWKITSFIIESLLAEGAGSVQKQYPDLEIGSYPFKEGGFFGTNLIVRGFDKPHIQSACQELEKIILNLGGSPEIQQL